MKLTPKEIEREARMIRDTEGWPLMNVLPMKRYNKEAGAWPGFGIILYGNLTVVKLLSIDAFVNTRGKDLVKIPSLSYKTIEAMVEDGWLVD
jgi:hypothetical protein